MTDPEMVGRKALSGKRIGFSASESADLPRLGLTEFHCRLVIAEVARALFLAGATVVYGGRLGKDSYTEILIDEAERFGGSARTLELFIAESEYSNLSREELEAVDHGLGEHGRLRLVSLAGQVFDAANAELGLFDSEDTAKSLTRLRMTMINSCDARFLVGGKLDGYRGIEPGVIEEARISLESGKPLLAAAGYGGAAAIVARTLFGWDPEHWPDDLPQGSETIEVARAVNRLEQAFASAVPSVAWDSEVLPVLLGSHRPSDLAASVVQLLEGVMGDS